MTTGCKKLPCNHIFHTSCLRSWFQRQQTCPTCRMDVLRPQPPPPTQQQPPQPAPQPPFGFPPMGLQPTPGIPPHVPPNGKALDMFVYYFTSIKLTSLSIGKQNEVNNILTRNTKSSTKSLEDQ